LLCSVWGYGWSGDTRLVDVHVQRLRAKVGAEIVQTVRGLGYKVPR
jgi:DNA-binding response OmpR family regulator